MNDKELIEEAREHIGHLAHSFREDSAIRQKLLSGESADQRISLVVRLANALEAAQPRTVATVEELDALPLNSVILDEGGMVRQAWAGSGGENWWWEVGSEGEMSSAQLVAHIQACKVPIRFTVVHAGGGDE